VAGNRAVVIAHHPGLPPARLPTSICMPLMKACAFSCGNRDASRGSGWK
jgi:hypothetical protein